MSPTTNENITVWDSPDSKVQTTDGTITYRKWCELEMARWAKSGKKTHLNSVKTGLGCERICIGRN